MAFIPPVTWSNIFAWWKSKNENQVVDTHGAGAPTDGTSGTFAGIAGPGSTYMDRTNGILYINRNTRLSPSWVMVTGLTQIGSGITAVNQVLQIESVALSSANITGTSAGQLGHAQGFPLVAAQGAATIIELISAILIYDRVTADYGSGGNITINWSAGGAAITGLISAANSLGAATDKFGHFVPLAAVVGIPVVNAGLNLVSSAAFTQPGTAAGICRIRVAYRVHATGL